MALLIAPVESMFQSDESMETMAELLPMVVAPVLVKVVKAAVPAVVAPMLVELMPVAVVLKFEDVIVRPLAPVLMEEAPRPDRVNAPLVAVRFIAPVVRVKPLLAVNKPALVMVPDPVVEMLPVVVTASPAFVGANDVPVLVHQPICPEVADDVIAPAQVRAPVEFVIVQPVELEPPPIKMSPVEVLLRFRAPVPLASMDKAMLVLSPVLAMVGPDPVAALVIVSSLMAEAVVVNITSSAELASAM